MIISPARIAAFEILSKIETERAFSSVLLPFYEENLSEQDKGLCHQLTLGVLRKQIYLDRLTAALSNGKKIDPAIRIILRIGLYQLLFLDKIPAHAAINDAVNLVQRAKKTSAKGFVNAILRRAIRELPVIEASDPVEKISIETSHPQWLIKKWVDQFGLEQTASLAEANNEAPKLDYRWTAKTTEPVKDSLQKEDADKNYLRELAENGKIYFQDHASQMVARAVKLAVGESFLDVCCAPGSKFTFINYLAGVPQKLFVGGDFYPHRLKTVLKTCRSVAAQNYQILAYDAERSLPFPDEVFDVALLDAPCTGTGTVRHNPEIRYFLEEKDFAELSLKQLNILQNASKTIKRGGRLIYSTCSLEIEENEWVCKRFLTENSRFSLIKPDLPEEYITAESYARTFPQRDKMDGFFIAVLQKS